MKEHTTKSRLLVAVGALALLGLIASLAATVGTAVAGDTPVPYWPHETAAPSGTAETYTEMRADGSYYDPSLGRRVGGDTPVPYWPHETAAPSGTAETYTEMRADGSYYDPSLGRRVGGNATKVAAPSGERIGDDWFRDAAKVAAPQTNTGLVDDDFHNANRVNIPQASPNGFDWGDFGFGAAAMLGFMFLMAGLGLGALAVRHRDGQFKTS